MIKLSELQYNVQVPLQEKVYNMPSLANNSKNSGVSFPDYELITTIEKTRDFSRQVDFYFIKFNRIGHGNRNDRVVGYLYFTYDESKKSSAFYGAKTRSSYRGKGILNYLISRWIEICLCNGVEDLYTTSKQRKPIFIYSLEKMSFEIKDLSLYDQGHNVYICRDVITNQKVLCFDNKEDGELFASSTINKETPHIIIPEMSDRYEFLARLLLENPYYAEDLDIADKISRETVESFPDRIRR